MAAEPLAPLFPRNHTALFAWRDMSRPGSEVNWRLVAYDRPGNSSVSSVQSFLISSPPSPPPLPPLHNSTFTVCPSGCNFTELQDAINAASTGDTVFALNGTHDGPIVINRSISVVGEGASNTSIDGQAQPFAVSIVSDDANLTDLTIRNGSTGVLVEGDRARVASNTVRDISWLHPFGIGFLSILANDTTIQNNSISDIRGPYNTGFGVFLRASWDGVVMNNTISNSTSGVSIQAFLGPDTGANNSVTGNTVQGNDVGIFTSGSSRDHNILGNRFLSNDLGIVLQDSDSKITNNLFMYNSNGFILGSASNTTVQGNNASSNNNSGSYITSGAGTNNTFTDNSVVNNNGTGISLSGPSFGVVTFRNNTIAGNSGPGFFSLGFNNTILTGNDISRNGLGFTPIPPQFLPFAEVLKNGQSGIVLINVGNTTIVSNNLTLNNNSGIYLEQGSSGNTISGNVVTSNGFSGITISTGAVAPVFFGLPPQGSISNIIQGNNASNNTIGIFVNFSEANTLDSNNASSNAEDGIRLQDAPNNSVSNNIARNNGRFGIYVNRSNNTPTTGNEVRFNFHGIFYNETLNNTITGNTASNNTNDGIKMLNPTDSTITDNTAQLNYIGIHVTTPAGSLNITNNTFPLPGNSFKNVWIDPVRLFLVSGNFIFSGGFGLSIFDAADGLIEGNFFQFSNVSLELVNSTNITIKDNTICDSTSLDISMANSTATLLNTTVDPSKVLLANSTLAGLGPPVSVNNIKIEAEGKLKEEGRKMALEAEAVVKDNRTRGEMEFQLKEREDGNKTKLSAHGKVDRVSRDCAGNYQLLGNATVREGGTSDVLKPFTLVLSNKSATFVLGPETFTLPVQLKVKFLEPGKPEQ